MPNMVERVADDQLARAVASLVASAQEISVRRAEVVAVDRLDGVMALLDLVMEVNVFPKTFMTIYFI